MKKRRAFLKWAGGKYLLIESIKQYLPGGELLIEPFVGAGSVFLNTEYDRYLLADINNDLIVLFNIVKKSPHKFIDDAKLLFTKENNQSTSYYQLRDRFNLSQDPYQRSLLFLYLNRHGYNGLCRYNSRGEFNVPFGQYKNVYFPEQEILFFAEKAKRAKFICASYQQAMKKAQPGSVIYCDPPYAPLSTSANFTAYYHRGFDKDEQLNLAKLAEKLSRKRNVPILISNHDTVETRLWYQNANIINVETRRFISCNSDSRKKISELLALFNQHGTRDSHCNNKC